MSPYFLEQGLLWQQQHRLLLAQGKFLKQGLLQQWQGFFGDCHSDAPFESMPWTDAWPAPPPPKLYYWWYMVVP